MNFITLKDSKLFAEISGDRNKIHTDIKIAKNFFFKQPIVHGVNLTILSLIKILNSKKKIDIKYLKINFKNFCLNNENFFVEKKFSKYFIKTKLNTKIDLQINYNKKNKFIFKSNKINFKYKKLIKFYNLKSKLFYLLNLFFHLLKVSKKIGNYNKKFNSIIYSIEIKKNILNVKKSFKTQRITKNVFRSTLIDEDFVTRIVHCKLLKLDINLKKFNLSSRLKEKIKSKKILIFGASGDVGNAITLFLEKANVQVKKISLKDKLNKKKLEIKLKKENPNFLFYLSSPRILNDKDNGPNPFRLYNSVYFEKFKIILDILYKIKFNTKVFYPSTFAISKKKEFSKIKSYLKAKENGEYLCRNHNYSKHVHCYRLPAYKSKANYNILGYYEGEDLFKIKNFLNSFLSL